MVGGEKGWGISLQMLYASFGPVSARSSVPPWPQLLPGGPSLTLAQDRPTSAPGQVTAPHGGWELSAFPSLL